MARSSSRNASGTWLLLMSPEGMAALLLSMIPAPRIRTNSRNRKRCPCTGAGEPVGEVRRRRNRLRCRSWRVPRRCLRPWPACRSLGACAWQRTLRALPSSTPARSDSWTSSRKSRFRSHGVVSGSVAPARPRDLRDACLKPPKRAVQAAMPFSMLRRTGAGLIVIANRRPANEIFGNYIRKSHGSMPGLRSW